MHPRLARRGLRLALGLLAGALLTARPAAACDLMTADTLAARLTDAARYEYRGEAMRPFVVLWQAHRPAPFPVRPDAVAVYAAEGRPLLLAYRHKDCLLGLLPVAREEVWTALRRLVGPIA